MSDSLRPITPFATLAEQPVIGDWLMLGPFVAETGASFEREYMFERHKILDIDYLAAAGGEKAAQPAQDQWAPNEYAGPPRLYWQRHHETNFGFTRRAGELLYRTVQRNAVFYMATYIDCEREEVAFVEAYHSGMRLFLNGELVLDQPYGGAKGLHTRQMLLPVRLRQGRNVFLAKVRPGYIADGVEFCLRNFSVRPAVIEAGGVVSTAPNAVGLFFGPREAARQVLEVRCANLGAAPAAVRVSVGDSAEEAVLEPGQSQLLRLGAPPAEPGAPVTHPFVLAAGGTAETGSFTYTPLAVPETKGTGYVYSDFHFDTTYHEEQRVYAMGAFDIVRRYCEQFERDPNFKGTLSEIDYLKPYFDMFPAHRDILRQAHQEGRAESDVFYNQPQELNCCGETFVRNMLYGQLWHEDVLGRRCYIYSPGDVFGHPAQMSQIAMKGECEGVGWDKHIFGFPPLFRHVSPDGSHTVHRRGHVDRNGALTQGLSVFLTGCDKTAPTDWLAKLAPTVQMAVPSDFHRAIEKDCEQMGNRLPLTSRDMSLYHAGTALSRIELKIGNRIAENMLLSAEKFAAFAGLLGATYPEKPIDKGWRQLLCGQHHDSITGTHNEISYVDLMVGYREAAELGAATLADTLAYLSRQAKAQAAAGEKAVRLFNPHCWDRTDICRTTVELPAGWSTFGLRDAAGQPVPCQVISREGDRAQIAFVASVPSLGYTTYYLTNRPARPATETTRQEGVQIENSAFRVVADPARGGLTSLFDKRAGRELLDTSGELVGAEITVHREVHNRHEEQHEMYTTGQSLFGHDYPATSHVLAGEVVQTLVLEQDLETMPKVRHEISLIEGVDRLDCRVMLADYQFEDDLFVVTYPTSLQGAVPSFDDRYCAVARRESRGLLDFRTHQMFMFSGCAVYPADRWLEYGPTVTLDLGEAGQASLGMTALISPADNSLLEVSDSLLMALTTKGIPVTPWPDQDLPLIGTQVANPNDDLLYHDFRIVLVTVDHPNRWAEKVLAAGCQEAAGKFRAAMAAGPAAFFAVDRDNREAKPMATLILGAPDISALQGMVAGVAGQLTEAETARVPAVAGAVAGPVDDYGITLANTGNIACSVERGGVLALLLFHTCAWYGATGNIERTGYSQGGPGGGGGPISSGTNFVPEQRTHVYTYSLFPHAGSWRQAQAYRQALQVNDPLIAVAADETGDALPETASFVTVDAPGVVVSAVKALGNPLAGMQGAVPELPERGIALRFYEADGRPAQGTFRLLPAIERAFKTSLLERPGAGVPADRDVLPFECGPFTIDTYGIITGPLTDRPAPAQLGPQAEAAQPVFVRSWEHDAGTMPMGYETVVASIGRDAEDLPGGKLKVNINVVNDYVDVNASGTVNLLLPEGWSASATTYKYDLAPLGHLTIPVVVSRPSAEAAGQVKIRYQRDGQEYQDVLEVGRAVDPTFALRLIDNQIVAAIENPGTESLECEVAIASPVETWPAAVVGPLSLAEITPRTVGLSIAPGERREVVFTVRTNDDPVFSAWWAVGKLMANGRIYLRRVDRHGKEPNWCSHDWWEAIRAGEKPNTSG